MNDKPKRRRRTVADKIRELDARILAATNRLSELKEIRLRLRAAEVDRLEAERRLLDEVGE